MGNKSIYSVGNDAATTGKVQRKTERSHEENQERAYVAASRRADRSIEARVQSARMASEIHKKRTGKGFRISEEIVVKEEMYEEEEEFFPRSCRLLGPHMQTASPEMNLRMEAYLTNRMAMSAMVAGNNDTWRQNDIHTQFAQFFPNANKQAQQQRMSLQMDQSPVSPSFSAQSQQERGQSFSSDGPTANEAVSASPGATTSPRSNPKTPATNITSPTFTQPMAVDSPMDFGSNESVFTAELPTEAKMLLAGNAMDMNDSFTQSLYGQDWTNNGPYYNMSDDTEGLKNDDASMTMMPDYYGDAVMPPAKYEHQDINWGSFVNEDWDNDQQ